MSKDIKAKANSKSSKRETAQVHSVLNDGLLALAKDLEGNATELMQHTVRLIESYEKSNAIGPLMDVSNRLDSIGVGLRRLQRQIVEQKSRRKRSEAKKKNLG